MFKSNYIHKNTKGTLCVSVMFSWLFFIYFYFLFICVYFCLQDVGCDYGIDSNAVEDRCGVCLGDGKSCEMVYKSFDEEEGLGESRTKQKKKRN